MLELSKYYPSSQTIHVRADATLALCGRTAQHGVVTASRDRLGMVSCKDCYRLYLAQGNGHESGSLAGLLQALALTAAGRHTRQTINAQLMEVMLNGDPR